MSVVIDFVGGVDGIDLSNVYSSDDEVIFIKESPPRRRGCKQKITPRVRPR